MPLKRHMINGTFSRTALLLSAIPAAVVSLPLYLCDLLRGGSGTCRRFSPRFIRAARRHPSGH